MRKLKFSILIAAVLLAGALASWCAVHAVVAPKTGQTISAGIQTVPSVLGQTAEEVLFYPWSLYETQPLSHISDFYGLKDDTSLMDLLCAFEALDVSLDWDLLWKSLLCNLNSDGVISATGNEYQIFLKDFPTQRQGVRVTADFAYATFRSCSFLIRPAQAIELTQEQQNAALDRVKADLSEFLSTPFLVSESTFFEMETQENELTDLLIRLFLYWDPSEYALWPLYDFFQQLESVLYNPENYLAPASLEEQLALLEKYGCTIQLITTPRQVIVLFDLNNGTILGVYYDIQLECYSGLGITC